MRAHGRYPMLVLRRVEPKAAIRPRRTQEAVALLPRAQQLGTHAGAAAELADAHVTGGRFHTNDYTDLRQSLDKTARLSYDPYTKPLQKE